MLVSEILGRIFETEDEIRRVFKLMLYGGISVDEGRRELKELREKLRRFKRMMKKEIARRRQEHQRLRWV